MSYSTYSQLAIQPTKTGTVSDIETILRANTCLWSSPYKGMDIVSLEPGKGCPQLTNSIKSFQTSCEHKASA